MTLRNHNWITFGGEPVTGMTPTQVNVFSDTPGLVMNAQQEGFVAHAYKLFCDAVNISVFPNGYHVQNRIAPDGTTVRMESNLGVHRVFVRIKGAPTDEENLPFWGCYQVDDYDNESSGHSIFDVFKYNKGLSALIRILRRRLEKPVDIFNVTGYCQAVVGTVVYWVKTVEQDTSSSDEDYYVPEYDYTVRVSAFTRRMTLYRSEGDRDTELGYYEHVRRTRRPYRFIGGAWEEYTGVINEGDDFQRYDVTSDGLLGVGATPWGMLVFDQFEPDSLSGVWTDGTAPPLVLAQRRSYYASPRTLEQLPDTSTYVIDWTGYPGTDDFKPPQAGSPYAIEDVKQLVAQFRWNRLGVWSSTVSAGNMVPPQVPTLWAPRVDWITDGYGAPRYTDQSFGLANHKALFSFGNAIPHSQINMADFGAAGVQSDYRLGGLWTDEAVYAPRVIGADLSLCARLYNSLGTEKQVALVRGPDFPENTNASFTISSVRLGRDAGKVMRL